MINDLLHRARFWRLRAEESRTIADGLWGTDARRIMYGLADDYERLAQDLERQADHEPQPALPLSRRWK